ncbi:MAG TPA: DUF309 domain-containing protein [Verrucomicrobiae bacterium]|nr:DUF309 domain-containing protein [Verrucomicrobiae bacterium]
MALTKTDFTGLIASLKGRGLPPQYLGYFECFNQQLFFEAHEVLEGLWLRERGGPKDLFYKGLIQLAGAFVHVQKDRRGPAAALLHLAQANFARYPDVFDSLELNSLGQMIQLWLGRLQEGTGSSNPLWIGPYPQLRLEAP